LSGRTADAQPDWIYGFDKIPSGDHIFDALQSGALWIGTSYIWTIPDNFNDLYRLPVEVTSALKNYVVRGFPVRVDGPAQVALFAYDNDSFIVESYLPAETDVRIPVAGSATKLRNLVTGAILTGQPQTQCFRRRQAAADPRVSFNAHLPPHSCAVFAVEK